MFDDLGTFVCANDYETVAHSDESESTLHEIVIVYNFNFCADQNNHKMRMSLEIGDHQYELRTVSSMWNDNNNGDWDGEICS